MRAESERRKGNAGRRVAIGFLSGCVGLLTLATAWGAMAASAAPDEFRVCADPNNLPFSDKSGSGFENKLAELVAHDLGKHVSYTWWAQRRGFVRNTLKAGDVRPTPTTRDWIVRRASRPRPYRTRSATCRAGSPIRSTSSPARSCRGSTFRARN